MSTISSLIVRLQAQTDAFNSAIEKSRKVVEKMANGVKKGMNIIAAAIKAVAAVAASAGAAIAGAFTAFTIKAGTIRELQQMAQVTGVGITELQKWTFAAKSVNIEADKMADIFKDTSDKIGDFLTTGGGAAVDMFEQLNLNVHDFIGLSPDQALMKLGAALDGVSQGEKIFFMEAIASDASHLLPLLENNSAELTRLGQVAERTGNVLDGKGVAAAARLSKAWSNLTNMADGFFKQLTVRMAPAIEVVYDYIAELMESFGGMEEVADKVARGIIDFAVNGIRGIANFIQAIGGIEVGFLKIQKTVIDTMGVIATMLKMIAPSTWARKFGINVGEITAPQDLANRSVAIDGRIREAEERFDFDKFNKNLDELVERIRSGLDRGEDPVLNEQINSLQDNTNALLQMRKTYTDTLNDRIQGGRNTGSIDINRGVADKQFKSAEIFEKAAQRFQDRINKGLLDPRAAAMNIEGLQTMISRYQGAGGFDIEGMKAAVENLGAAARDMFATPQERPLTAADYERVFNEAQAKAKEQEAKQEAAWQADIEAAAHLGKVAEVLQNQDEVAVKLDLRTDAGNLVGKVTGSREFAQAVQTLASQAINNTARGVAA